MGGFTVCLSIYYFKKYLHTINLTFFFFLNPLNLLFLFKYNFMVLNSTFKFKKINHLAISKGLANVHERMAACVHRLADMRFNSSELIAKSYNDSIWLPVL